MQKPSESHFSSSGLAGLILLSPQRELSVWTHYGKKREKRDGEEDNGAIVDIDGDDETMTTSWRKVIFEGNIPPWELHRIGVDFAAFSTRKFVSGELICKERPTVFVNGHHPFSEEQIGEITSKVDSLGEDDKAAFYDMANVFPEVPCAAAGIFMTNSFDMTDAPHGESCAMYCAIARLNHSCTPNAQQTHCPDTGEEILIASRNIEIGEEINDCYIDLRQSRADRRRQLLELYRFECNCKGCDEHSKADDTRRVRASQLEAFTLAVAEEDPYGALDIAVELIQLLTKPECLVWSARYVAGAHLSAFQIAGAIDDTEAAEHHLRQAHKWNLLLQGDSTPDSRRTAQLLGELNDGGDPIES